MFECFWLAIVAKLCLIFPKSTQLTHGYPQNPSPLFASNAFPIEHRAGMEDQTQETVLRKVAELAAKLPSDPAAVLHSRDKGKAKETDVEALLDVAKWASDWHLLAFLHTQMLGSLLNEVCRRTTPSFEDQSSDCLFVLVCASSKIYWPSGKRPSQRTEIKRPPCKRRSVFCKPVVGRRWLSSLQNQVSRFLACLACQPDLRSGTLES